MEAPDLFANAAKRFPNALCVTDGLRRQSFAEADERAARAASAFQAAGLAKGDRVALLAENEVEYLELIAACGRAGMPIVPLNYRLAYPELEFILRDSSPRLLIAGPGYAETAARLGVPRTWHLGEASGDSSYEARLSAAAPATEWPSIDVAAPGRIVYTSGTTGRPKGAVISQGALAARFSMISLEAGIQPGDSLIQVLPMFHIAADISCSFSYRGAANIFMHGAFDPSEVVRVIESSKATHMVLVPTQINLLCEEPSLAQIDRSALRMLIYGASGIPPEVLKRAIRLFGCGFLQFFGMTELSGCSMLRPSDHDPDLHPELLASAGTDSLSYCTLVVDADDKELPPGRVGEVIARGPCVMDRYWNNPEASAEALRGGWMHTGDLGYRDASGYLFVTDRLKDMIISGGENVYPREVEDVLFEHPSVLSAAVIGIPDQRWGEAVQALVVPRGQAPPAEELLDHCRRRLARYKVPKALEFVESLPTNATGKVLKSELRERYRRQVASG